jgi:hypothetical protein
LTTSFNNSPSDIFGVSCLFPIWNKKQNLIKINNLKINNPKTQQLKGRETESDELRESATFEKVRRSR